MKFILIGFSLRILVAIWNGFFGPSFGAEGDAVVFHEIATEVATTGVFDTKFNIGWIYAFFLGTIYQITTVHSIFLTFPHLPSHEIHGTWMVVSS